MSVWTTPAAIRAQLQRDWKRGKLLTAIAQDAPLFPLRLPLKGPASQELSQRFTEVRAWIAQLQGAAKSAGQSGYRLTMRAVDHRVIGNNQLPAEVWLDTFDDALALIGKRREAARFQQLLAETAERCPALLSWLAKRPLRALELEAVWRHLLDVVLWRYTHPRPGIYLRQMDIPAIHSKFIEQHKRVLSELFDLALPQGAIDNDATGHLGFERRYGFRDKPRLIRFRILDAHKALLATGTDNDLTVTADTFARLDLNVASVFITENEINFLAFPPAPDSLVIFGSGYGFEALGAAHWLQCRTIYYWGDIDTHGFAILDQLRARFSQARAFLMDRETLLAHRAHWVNEQHPALRDLQRLNAHEAALYDDLRHDRLGSGVRLEQEKIGFQWLENTLACL